MNKREKTLALVGAVIVAAGWFLIPAAVDAASGCTGGVLCFDNSAGFPAPVSAANPMPTKTKLVAPDGGLEDQKGNGSGAAKVEVVNATAKTDAGVAKSEEQGPVVQTAGCQRVSCSLGGDGGTVALVTGQRYELTVGSSSAVELANGVPCVSFTGTAGKNVNENTTRYWTAPVGAGTDGGLAVMTCCSEQASGAWVEFCPAP